MDKTLDSVRCSSIHDSLGLHTGFNTIFHSAGLLCMLFIFVPVLISNFLVQVEIEKYFVASIL
jgi:hypothetical protein